MPNSLSFLTAPAIIRYYFSILKTRNVVMTVLSDGVINGNVFQVPDASVDYMYVYDTYCVAVW